MRNLAPYHWRKEIPHEVEIPVLKALQHYPELQTKKIEFRFSSKPGNSIMKAQPLIKSVLRLGDDRSYIVFINKHVQLGEEEFPIQDLPQKVLIGWFGHELGHIIDYEGLSKWGLLRFGIGYLLSKRFVRAAENRADHIAIKHGLGSHILETKNFILNHAGLSETYKNKIRKLYPSPEQIMELIHGEESLKSLA